MGTLQRVNKNTAVKNSAWKLMESFMSKGVSMLVSIVLARILLPEDYGVIALTSVFINLTDILLQAGFSTALVSKEKVTDDDYSTVLGISLIGAVVLYIILFLCSPIIANIYKTPVLENVLRAISLTLFCQAFAAVRIAIVSREMKFKVLFFCTMISNIVSGILGIVFAVLGFGVWALVLQQLLQQFLLTVILFMTVRIKVKLFISKKSINEILPFSLKVLVSSLLSFIGDSFYSVAIGKFYSMENLGYYEKGIQFPRQFSLYTFSAVSGVFLPVFAAYKDNYQKLNEIFRRVINVSAYIIIPLMVGLSITARPFIVFLLTDKWIPCVWILRWFCLYYIATPIIQANVQLHFAVGKGEARIKTEIMRIIMMLILLVIVIKANVSIEIIAASLAVIQVVIAIFISVETQRLTGYRILNSVIDAVPTMLSTILMCLGIYFLSMVLKTNNSFILFIVEVFGGMFIYWISSIIFQNKAYCEVIDMVRILLSRRKKA